MAAAAAIEVRCPPRPQAVMISGSGGGRGCDGPIQGHRQQLAAGEMWLRRESEYNKLFLVFYSFKHFITSLLLTVSFFISHNGRCNTI